MGREAGQQALALGAIGVLMLWHALRRFRLVRLAQDTARSKAASAPQGLVELQGIAWPNGEDTRRSAAGVEVVYHALKVQRERSRRSGKDRRKEWVTVARKDFAPPFFLVDATGLVSVDPGGAELELISDRTRTWDSLNQDERARVLEATGGESIAGFPPSESMFGLFASNFRIVESEIRVGSSIYARGDFRTAEGARESLRLRGLSQFHGRIFDSSTREQKRIAEALGDDRDGERSALEAIEGLYDAAASDRDAARTSESEAVAFPLHGRLSASTQHQLFIADRHEEHLVKGLGLAVYLQFAGGVLLIAAGLLRWAVDFGSGPPVPVSVPRPTTEVRVHEELRTRCLGGGSEACDELLRRAGELRISAGYREQYSRLACGLGLQQHCGGAKSPKTKCSSLGLPGAARNKVYGSSIRDGCPPATFAAAELGFP